MSNSWRSVYSNRSHHYLCRRPDQPLEVNVTVTKTWSLTGLLPVNIGNYVCRKAQPSCKCHRWEINPGHWWAECCLCGLHPPTAYRFTSVNYEGCFSTRQLCIKLTICFILSNNGILPMESIAPAALSIIVYPPPPFSNLLQPCLCVLLVASKDVFLIAKANMLLSDVKPKKRCRNKIH